MGSYVGTNRGERQEEHIRDTLQQIATDTAADDVLDGPSPGTPYHAKDKFAGRIMPFSA